MYWTGQDGADLDGLGLVLNEATLCCEAPIKWGKLMATDWQNKLYFGDNLDILREYAADETVDLIYLDPPFNSKAI